MPFNGSGVFVRVRNWVADATAGIKIRADYHDTEDDGFATGLSNCITKDGQTIVTQNIPMSSKRITGLADPVSPQDAATKAVVDAVSTNLSNTYVQKAGGIMTGPLAWGGTSGTINVLCNGQIQGIQFNFAIAPASFFINSDGTSIVLHGGLGNGYFGINFQDQNSTASWASIGPSGMLVKGVVQTRGLEDETGTDMFALIATLKARIEALEGKTP